MAVPASAALCGLVLAWLAGPGAPALAIDRPNERSLHQRPVPRVGGLGILAGVVPALLFAGMPGPVIIASLLLGVVSFFDDRHGLPILLRFGSHFAAVIFFMLYLPQGTVASWVWPVLALALVWMTNLYNFMDGSDGLAGGMAVFGFGACAIAAAMGSDEALAVSATVVCAAALAFLFFNFHPARVFMGDAGSIPLGFLAGCFGMLGWTRGLWPAWFPVAAFGPFIADASVTLGRRMLRGERFWQAHRTHYYQRLVQSGFGHRNTALAAYGVMATSVLLALVALRVDGVGRVAVGVTWIVLHVGAGTWIDRRWRAFEKSRGGRA